MDEVVKKHLLAEEFYEARMYDDAIEYFDKIIALGDNDFVDSSYDYKIKMYTEMNNFKEALTQIQKAMMYDHHKNKNNPYSDLSQFNYQSGLIHLKRNKELDLAYSFFNLSNTRNPEMEKAEKMVYIRNIESKRLKLSRKENVSGEEYMNALMYEEAIKCFEKAIAENPKDMKGYVNKGLALLKSFNFDECIGECKKAIEIAGEGGEGENKTLKAKVLYTIGMAYFEKNDLDESERFLKLSHAIEKVKEISDKLAEIEKIKLKRVAAFYRKKAYEYEKCREQQKAIENYTEALKYDQKNLYCYMLRANNYFELDDYDSAIADSDKCLMIDPTFELASFVKDISLQAAQCRRNKKKRERKRKQKCRR